MSSEAGRERRGVPPGHRRTACRRARRGLAATGCLALAGAGLARAPRAGADDGLTNVATASATASMPDVTRTAWSLRATSTPIVAPSNVAAASATDCAGCDATAAAFQVVLASQASTLDASNQATATETSCTACSTVAVADQWVVAGFNGRISLTPEGQIALEQVHLQLLSLAWPRANGQDVAGETAQLAAEVDDVLTHDVVVQPSPPGSPVGPGAAFGGPGRWPGWPGPHARSRTVAAGGQSVSVLPEPGYTIYVYSQQDLGSPVGAP